MGIYLLVGILIFKIGFYGVCFLNKLINIYEFKCYEYFNILKKKIEIYLELCK